MLRINAPTAAFNEKPCRSSSSTSGRHSTLLVVRQSHGSWAFSLARCSSLAYHSHPGSSAFVQTTHDFRRPLASLLFKWSSTTSYADVSMRLTTSCWVLVEDSSSHHLCSPLLRSFGCLTCAEGEEPLPGNRFEVKLKSIAEHVLRQSSTDGSEEEDEPLHRHAGVSVQVINDRQSKTRRLFINHNK